jgi:DNA-binding MarR family transcriptional regulator
MNSKLKALCWPVGIVVTAVITKGVEDHFEWSLFSPVIDSAWSWIVVAALWSGQRVSLPLCVLVAVLVAALGSIAFLVKSKARLAAKLSAANDKLNPKLVTLDESQQKVLAIVVALTERDDDVIASRLHEQAGLSRLVCQRALDVLEKHDLIETGAIGFGDYVFLTEAGREYVLHPQTPLRWVAQTSS